MLVGLQIETTSSVSTQHVYTVAVWHLLSYPGIYIHQAEGICNFYCLIQKTKANWGELNCPSFQMATVGLETQPSLQSSALINCPVCYLTTPVCYLITAWFVIFNRHMCFQAVVSLHEKCLITRGSSASNK